MFKSLLAALALSLAFAANAFAGAVNINTADAASLAAACLGSGSAPQPDPAAPNAPSVASGTTPPHGDEGVDVMAEKPDEAS